MVSTICLKLLRRRFPRDILNNIANDIARDVTDGLDSIGTDRGSHIAFLPFAYKVPLIGDMLKGSTDDDDEQAILRILRTSKSRSRAEYCQLVASAGWEQFDSSFDGSEYGDLETLFSF